MQNKNKTLGTESCTNINTQYINKIIIIIIVIIAIIFVIIVCVDSSQKQHSLLWK